MGPIGLEPGFPLVYNALTIPKVPDMADSPGTLFDSLLDVMARLRGEQGCPWDREQTRASLMPYLIEEAYEALEALEGGERDAMMEELGDLLFQVVFHAQVARELGEFTMADLLERLVAKMVRRHPHVFGEAKVSTAREAFSQWERIKHEEATQGGAPRSVLDGVPQSAIAVLSSVTSVFTTRSTLSAPATARPHGSVRPTRTAQAPPHRGHRIAVRPPRPGGRSCSRGSGRVWPRSRRTTAGSTGPSR